MPPQKPAIVPPARRRGGVVCLAAVGSALADVDYSVQDGTADQLVGVSSCALDVAWHWFGILGSPMVGMCNESLVCK